MRHETYRTAFDEANAELEQILLEFEELRMRKEQVEKVVEALKPFLGLYSDSTVKVAAPEFSVTDFTSSEPAEEVTHEFTFTQITPAAVEPVAMTAEAEAVPVSVSALEEATPEQVAYFRQPSADPFQKRIDDALWGWQQRPEGLLSPI